MNDVVLMGELIGECQRDAEITTQSVGRRSSRERTRGAGEGAGNVEVSSTRLEI
jgi:hypothetical protein